MPIFQKYLEELRVGPNSSVDAHLAAVRSLFQWRLPVAGVEPYRQRAIHSVASSLGAGANGGATPFSASFQGRAAAKRNEIIGIVEAIIQEAVNSFEPAPPPAPLVNYNTLVQNNQVQFQMPSLQNNIGGNFPTKIASIYALGQQYRGHGATTALGAGVLHCHVGNGDGVAFRWNGPTLVIHGVGQKYANAAAGNSGYRWTTR